MKRIVRAALRKQPIIDFDGQLPGLSDVPQARL
jgi:hypothetical protein